MNNFVLKIPLSANCLCRPESFKRVTMPVANSFAVSAMVRSFEPFGRPPLHLRMSSQSVAKFQPSRILPLTSAPKGTPASLEYPWSHKFDAVRHLTRSQLRETRGRALPLIGVTLKISGSGTVGLQLMADAVFLGSPQMRVSGTRLFCLAPQEESRRSAFV
jgi:hypothetical protein